VVRAAAGALVLLFGLAVALPAGSQPESPPQLLRARGVLLEYDAAAESISVKESGRVRSYFLLAGQDAGETEVVIESAPARVSDLRPGAPIIVSWRPDDGDRTRRVVHKVEVPTIPKSYRDDLR
jgi:hypothetical protein